MISLLHFLRPFWFLALIPWLMLTWILWRKNPKLQGWEAVCDKHLLRHLLQQDLEKKRPLFSRFSLVISMLFIIISLTGPTWSRLPVPVFQAAEARVFLLSLSDAMLKNDILPDRLSRAKFILKDILERKNIGQSGMVAYTDEPFIVSPLTNDGLTIMALLPSLTPAIMPIQGDNLEKALEQGKALIHQAGFTTGNILVLTSESPSKAAIDFASDLAGEGIYSSISALYAAKTPGTPFGDFARAGKGAVLTYNPDSRDLDQWLTQTASNRQFNIMKDDQIPQWRDEGRWFLIPAILFLLPVFRRGWLQGIGL